MTGRAGKALRSCLRAPAVFAWRWLTGKPLDGVARTDAGWFTRGHKTLDRSEAPRPPGTLRAEVGGDIRAIRTEHRELRVRRSLGRELRETERQILAERDSGQP